MLSTSSRTPLLLGFFILVSSLPVTSSARRLGQKVAGGKGIKDTVPFYHSSDELHEAIQDLSSRCNGELSISQVSKVNSGDNPGQEVTLDVVRFSRKGGATDGQRKKAVFIFNEHARELVSGESALHFLKTLCGSGDEARDAPASAPPVSRFSATDLASFSSSDFGGLSLVQLGTNLGTLLEQVKGSVDLTIVPNANPIARRTVEEKGAWCKRTNEDNVDLNRNWGDDHRDPDVPMGDELYPGPSGFSEPETQLLRDLVQETQPDLFLSIHSGAYLLGAPFGYTQQRNPANQAKMVSLLGPISAKYCGGKCPFGGLAAMINYNSNGCDIDYVSETLGVPYAYTWEIYTSPEIRSRYEEKAERQRSSGEILDSQIATAPWAAQSSASSPSSSDSNSSASAFSFSASSSNDEGKATQDDKSEVDDGEALLAKFSASGKTASTLVSDSSPSTPDSWKIGMEEVLEGKRNSNTPSSAASTGSDPYSWTSLGFLQERKEASRTRATAKIDLALRTGVLEPESAEDPDDCFAQFNPPDEDELNAVVENWTGAYLELLQELTEA